MPPVRSQTALHADKVPLPVSEERDRVEGRPPLPPMAKRVEKVSYTDLRGGVHEFVTDARRASRKHLLGVILEGHMGAARLADATFSDVLDVLLAHEEEVAEIISAV